MDELHFYKWVLLTVCIGFTATVYWMRRHFETTRLGIYDCHVVSRDTYEDHNVGMLYQGDFIVNGFYDGVVFVIVTKRKHSGAVR